MVITGNLQAVVSIEFDDRLVTGLRKKSAILMAYSREGICCFDSILAIVFRLMPVADASSFWVMPRSALASTSLQVIVSVMVFMSISKSVFIYMHLQIQNCSGLFRYNNPTVLSVPKKGLMKEHGRIF